MESLSLSETACAAQFSPTSQYQRLLGAIASVQFAFADDQPARCVFDILLEALLDATESEYGFIGEIDEDEDGRFLRTYAITNIAWNDETRAFYSENAPSGIEFRNLNTLFGHTIRTGEPVVTSNPDAHDSSAGRPAGHPRLDTYLGLPLKHGNNLVGMVGLANRAGGYTDSLIEFIAPLIGTCSNLIRRFQVTRERDEAYAALERRTEELARAKEAADAASKSKSEFIAVISHELRTPMNGVLGCVELLRDHALEQEAAHLVETIGSSSELLLGIINDILDFLSLDSGKLAVRKQVFSPRVIVQAVVQSLEPLGHSGDNRLLTKIHDAVPEFVESDPVRIQQVLTNLVGNGLKFTQGGVIEISVDVESSHDDRYELCWKVRDTGPGIAPEVQNLIFEPFFQGDPSSTRKVGGSGLGLAICQKLARVMNGSMGMESTVGEGTTFWLTIPVTAARRPEVKVARRTVSETADAPFRILLVEDNVVNQQVAKRMLDRAGATVVLAEDGLDAIERFSAERFDLVLMDCHMPRMDGYEATLRLRAIEKTTNVSPTPVVALTANVQPQDVEACLECGMNQVLAKPVRRDELLELLAQIETRQPMFR